jgi:hypothetical protein
MVETPPSHRTMSQPVTTAFASCGRLLLLLKQTVVCGLSLAGWGYSGVSFGVPAREGEREGTRPLMFDEKV